MQPVQRSFSSTASLRSPIALMMMATAMMMCTLSAVACPRRTEEILDDLMRDAESVKFTAMDLKLYMQRNALLPEYIVRGLEAHSEQYLTVAPRQQLCPILAAHFRSYAEAAILFRRVQNASRNMEPHCYPFPLSDVADHIQTITDKLDNAMATLQHRMSRREWTQNLPEEGSVLRRANFSVPSACRKLYHLNYLLARDMNTTSQQMIQQYTSLS